MSRRLLPFLFLFGVCGADELSGPGRKTLVAEEWGTIFCQETCAVRGDSAQRQFRITTDKGPISLSRTSNGWVVQASNQNIRLLHQQSQGNPRLLVTFNGSRYWFDRSPNEFCWNFPSGKTFFHLREGEVRSGIGKEGAFKIHKHSGADAYKIESEAGESEVILGRKRSKGTVSYVLVQQSGEDLSRHPLLCRGVVFDNGPVGVFIRMPRNPVLQALDWKQVQTVGSTFPYPEPKEPVGSQPATDPLQAVEAPRNEDPLHLQRKPFEKDRSMFDPSIQAPWSDQNWSQPAPR